MNLFRKAWLWAVEPVAERDKYGGLDGLRTFLLPMVVFGHLHLLGVAWMAISSFFVISGFLITHILLNDYAASPTLPQYFKRFYIRRALRVFPAYYFYLLLLTIAALLVPRLSHIGEHLPWLYTYTYNFWAITGQGEHTRAAGHLWSLSVEEQFYVAWPLVIAITPERHRRTVALALVVAGPFLRALIAWMMPITEPFRIAASTGQAMYLLTTSHLDALALGALINFVQYRPKVWHLLALAVPALAIGMLINGPGILPVWEQGGLLALGWPLYLPRAYMYVWGYSVVNVFWFMVICMVIQRGPLQRFLSLQVFDYIGKRSYGIYLYHFPLLALCLPAWEWSQRQFGYYWGGAVFFLPFYAVVLFFAILSFKYLEGPALKLKNRFSSPARSSLRAAVKVADPAAPPRPTTAEDPLRSA